MNENVSKAARKARAATKMTQTDLATKLGTFPQFISSMECGRCSIPNHLINSYAQALDIDKMKLINAKVKDYRNHLLKKVESV